MKASRALECRAILLGLVTFGGAAMATDITWTGAQSGRWNNTNNWSLFRLPAAGDHAIIPAGTPGCTNDSGATIAQITVNGTLSINGNTFTLTTTGNVAGVLNLAGGTLGGTGQLTIAGAFNWTGGTMSGAGRTILAPDATGTISGGSVSKTLTRLLENRGVIIQSGTGNSMFSVNVGGTLDNPGVYQIADNSSLYTGTSPPGVMTNRGLFEKTGGGASAVNAAFCNAEGGIIGNTSSTNLLFTTSFSQTGTGAIGAGIISLAGGNGLLMGTLGGPGTLQVISGNLMASNSSAIGCLWLYGGTLTGAGELTVTQLLTWTGGTMSGAGRTILAPGATGTISGGSVSKTLTRLLENRGVIIQSGTGNSMFSVNVGGTLDNPGVYQIADSSSLHTGTSPPGIMTNRGRFEKTGGGSIDVDAFLHNAIPGVIHVATGTVNCTARLVQEGAIEIAAQAVFQQSGGLTNNGMICGQGTVHVGSGRLVNNGSLAPGGSPGMLSISGHFTQTGAGVLHLELGGTLPGTEHDRLAVSGNAALNGTLSVTLTNGYTPAQGDLFVLLTHGSFSGAFSATQLPSLPEDSHWGVYHSAASYQLYRELTQTTGGVPTAWYRSQGVGPADGETWTAEQWNALDGQDPDKDGDINTREYVADTDPLDSNEWFRITGLTLQSPRSVLFTSSSNRLYTLHATPSMTDHVWTNVSGQGPHAGIGGADSMSDTNQPWQQHYRIQVAVPPAAP